MTKRNIIIEFPPPNVIAIAQPISAILLSSVLINDDDTNNESYIEKFEAVDILHAIRWIIAA